MNLLIFGLYSSVILSNVYDYMGETSRLHSLIFIESLLVNIFVGFVGIYLIKIYLLEGKFGVISFIGILFYTTQLWSIPSFRQFRL